MIYFSELNKKGNEHAMINSCLFDVINTIFPKSKLVFRGDRAQFDKYPKYPSVECNFIDVYVPVSGSKLSWLKKFWIEMFEILHVLKSAKRHSAEMVFFTSCSPFGNLILQILLKLRYSKLNTIAVLHGELEYIKTENATSILTGFFKFCMRSALRYSPVNMRFLVLGLSIKESLKRFKLIDDNRVLYMEHPYIYPPTVCKTASHRLTFGQFGVAKKNKQSDVFFDFAKDIAAEYGSDKACFSVLGKVLPDVYSSLNEHVNYMKGNEFVPQYIYEKLCAEVDYAIFLYTDQNYELTASGAFLDAIRFGKPVLCLRNKFFSQLYDDIDMEIGWIFEDSKSLYQKIRNLIDHHNIAEYNVLSANMKMLARRFSVDNAHLTLKKQLADSETTYD